MYILVVCICCIFLTCFAHYATYILYICKKIYIFIFIQMPVMPLINCFKKKKQIECLFLWFGWGGAINNSNSANQQ